MNGGENEGEIQRLNKRESERERERDCDREKGAKKCERGKSNDRYILRKTDE